MNAIVVVDQNWGIGREGNLLVHLPGDLKYYKEKTIGNHIIVGRKTLESFPGGKPLPGRENIVLTRDPGYAKDGCVICHTVEDVQDAVKDYDPETVFVAGGAEIYQEFFSLCDVFYVTKIDETFEADRYFPDLDEMGLKVAWESELQEEKGITYRFLKYVRENNLDVGFAYDGDADRCLCVDEKGNVITGDHILYIYGCYMKERGKLLTNTVVTTVMSNFGLYKAFDEKGIGYAKTAVGDKYVYEYMAKNGCRIGGEQSGHIIFSKYASTGDGILTSLKMMEVMLAKKLPMSKLAEPLKIYPQVLENVRVTDKKAAQDDEVVQAAVKAVAEALGDTGRILVRESGTEPVVRVMVEAPDHDTCQKYVTQVVETIKSRGYGV